MSTSERPLFGGAITTALPDSFIDISTFREVPDNQEVFVDRDTDQSIVIELLQLAEETSNQDE
ncbi:hypothetical protein HK102_002265, partial [Quaeritorhiza haematococci]